MRNCYMDDKTTRTWIPGNYICSILSTSLFTIPHYLPPPLSTMPYYLCKHIHISFKFSLSQVFIIFWSFLNAQVPTPLSSMCSIPNTSFPPSLEKGNALSSFVRGQTVAAKPSPVFADPAPMSWSLWGQNWYPYPFFFIFNIFFPF